MINSKLIPTARSRDGGKNKLKNRKKRKKYNKKLNKFFPFLKLFLPPSLLLTLSILLRSVYCLSFSLLFLVRFFATSDI